MQGFKDFINSGNRRLKIVSDVDGVLLDFQGAFYMWLKENHPELKPDPKKWDMGHPANVMWPYVYEFFNSGIMNKLPALASAPQFFNAISKNNEVIICTAMPDRYKADRIKNLKDRGFKFDKLFIQKENKTDFIINQLRPDIAIEDKPKNVITLSNAGIKVYYPKTGYTKGLEKYGTPYLDWKHLYKMISNLVQENVLNESIEEYEAKNKYLKKMIELHNKAWDYEIKFEAKFDVSEAHFKQLLLKIGSLYSYVNSNWKKVNTKKINTREINMYLEMAEDALVSAEVGTIYEADMAINACHNVIQILIGIEENA